MIRRLTDDYGSTYRQWEVCVVLEEDRHSLSKIAKFQGANVLPAKQDFTFMRIIQAHRKFQNRTLPSTIGAHNDLPKMFVKDIGCKCNQKRLTQSCPGCNTNETF